MTSISVAILRDGRCYNYVVPPGDTPSIGDYVLVSDDSTTRTDDLAATMELTEVVAVNRPAHPRATRMYFARLTRQELLDRQACNNMRTMLMYEPDPLEQRHTAGWKVWGGVTMPAPDPTQSRYRRQKLRKTKVSCDNVVLDELTKDLNR